MKRINIFSSILLAFLGITSFAQVRKSDKIDKINRNTYNFLVPDSCTKGRQKKDRSLYEVYSDRSENICYLDNLGLKQGESQDFMTAYYVIGEKDDYLELVAKDPEAIGKPKGLFSILYGSKYRFEKPESVKYIGWIHRNNLLHYSRPRTSIVNYRPVQYMTGFSDLQTLFELNGYVKKDSLFIYKDPDFKERSPKSLNTRQFVYLYKYNVARTAALISNQENLTTTDSSKRVMGWVPSQLVTPIGQRGVYRVGPSENMWVSETQGAAKVPGMEISKGFVFKNYMPCATEAEKDSLVSTSLPLSVWNHYDNKLINVKGNDLLIRKIDKIGKDNKVLNFHFIFDCKSNMRDKLMFQITSLQRIWVLLSEDPRFNDLDVSFAASSYGCGKFFKLEKTDSFADWVDYLQNVFLDNLTTTENNWEGITKCFRFAIEQSNESPSFENNIIMVVGEKKMNLPYFRSENREWEIFAELAQVSARILFYQLESRPEDSHQDFILQSKQVLDTVGSAYLAFLKDYTVENRLVKVSNLFAKLPTEQDNVYLFDAPEQSLYTGGLAFPKINERLTPLSFDIALDSLLSKTFGFNHLFLESLERNAAELGFLRSKPTNRMERLIMADGKYRELLPLIPRNYDYEQFMETDNFVLEDESDSLAQGYLLDKNELNELIQSYKSSIPMIDTTATKRSVRKARRKLRRVYCKTQRNLNRLLFYKELKRRKSLGRFFYIKTGIPVRDSTLNALRIKDVRKRRKLSHTEYVLLMMSLRSKISNLEDLLEGSPQEEQYSDGSNKAYYFVEEKNLF